MSAEAWQFALECDGEGRITEILRDDIGLRDRLIRGDAFSEVVDRLCVDKAENFLAHLREHGAAFDWEINVPAGAGVVCLHLAGSRQLGRFIIAAAGTRRDLVPLFEEATRTSLVTPNRASSEVVEISALDELSRVNNELANAQRELAKKTAELERLSALKSQFLGMAAHDLRNPLGVVLTFSDLLLQTTQGTLSDDQRDILIEINESSKAMRQMITDFLDISSIEAGTLRMITRPTDVLSVVRRSVTLNRIVAERKGVEIREHFDVDKLVLMIDALKLQQVFDNLLTNAIKFSPANAVIEVSVKVEGDELTVAVSDQGSGMTEAQIAGLFRPFQTRSTLGTAGERGTGLGLAIAQRILQGHRGRISVESRPGAGARFAVHLPLGA